MAANHARLTSTRPRAGTPTLRWACPGTSPVVRKTRSLPSDPEFVLLCHPKAPGRDHIAPDIQKLPLLIEDLDANIVAVGHIEPAFGVQHDGVRDAELAWLAAELAPGFGELAFLVEVHDPGV